MSLQFPRGKIVGPGELEIALVDQNGNPTDAYRITYTLYDATTGVEVPIGQIDRVPVHPELGLYYAHFQIPQDAALGQYRIRWIIQQTTTSQPNVVMEEFKVMVPESFEKTLWSPIQIDMLRSLRILLRDNNPGRNYRFRPPTSEGTISKYNQVFAYVWEDEELIEYMQRGVDIVNLWPPETHWNTVDAMVRAKPAWSQMIFMGAMSHAAMALTLNWISEEFSYSIGGISLDIEKSSKYEGIKNNAESQLDKLLEAKTRTTKIIRGLQQSRYGVGLRSAFGSHLGKGILSPRSYMGI